MTPLVTSAPQITQLPTAALAVGPFFLFRFLSHSPGLIISATISQLTPIFHADLCLGSVLCVQLPVGHLNMMASPQLQRTLSHLFLSEFHILSGDPNVPVTHV